MAKAQNWRRISEMEIAVGIELDRKLEKKKLKRHRIEPKLEKTNGGDIELD